MKEKSKTAAKSRREKENNEFSELARLLPLPWAIASQLDKASVIRLTCSYLHMRSLFPNGLHAYVSPMEFFELPEIKELGSQLMQTLEGFVFIIGVDGKVIYVSETASAYLGLSQVELTGNSIFEYLHPADQALMAEILQKDFDALSRVQDMPAEYEVEKNFTIRLRCILAKRNAGLTYHGHKVVHCNGFVKFKLARSITGVPALQHIGLVAMGSTLPANSATEYRIPASAFLLRMSLDLKIIFLDARVADLTGYDPQELLDRSLYSYVHACDAFGVREAHKALLEKCQAITGYYRFLSKSGVWIWIQSQFALIHNARSSRPHCIVCVSHVISHDMTSEDGAIWIEQHQGPGNSVRPSCQYKTTMNGGGATTAMTSSSDSTAAHSSTKGSNSGNSLVGAYSEQFYGPHGLLLMTSSMSNPQSNQYSLNG